MNNEVFIDGQNLTLGTKIHSSEPWKVDLAKFRYYLERKYNICKAYYYIGYYLNRYRPLYEVIINNGFTLVFREFSDKSISNKKGNVDTDIVFEMMRKIADRDDVDLMYLVSGDGDYFKTVNYLIKKGKFGKILAPEESVMSSLYKKNLNPCFYSFLSQEDMKKKIIYKENAGSA